MRITELATIIPPKKPNSQESSADFSIWLEEKKLTNPTQQSSGDEYYWQHQNDLQQSSVHFNPLAKGDHKSQEVLSLENIPEPATPSTTITLAYSPESKFTLDITSGNQKLSQQSTPQLSGVIEALNKEVEQSPLTFINENFQLSKDNPASKLSLATANDLNPITPFKNSHLFVTGEHAELTLNLSHLKKEEQKNLIQLIENHLKQKGLTLSRLIINGVNND